MLFEIIITTLPITVIYLPLVTILLKFSTIN